MPGTPNPSPAPRLIAIGGWSGTGKSTLGAALAADFGAVQIRSDVERKMLFNVAETDRLPATHYTVANNIAVYQRVYAKARSALAAGHSAVVDAVFSKPEERAAIEAIARETSAHFDGLWLTAPRDTLLTRVGGRTGDASDATVDVVAQQLQRDSGAVTWTIVDASGSRDTTLRAAMGALLG
jgi:uncharacterized protein